MILENVYRYRSPPAYVHPGRTIRPGCEEVEIITGGSGAFEVDGTPREVHAGGMLWFRGGESIHVTAPAEEPYDCVVLSFSLEEEESIEVAAPRRLSWCETPEAARRFGAEVMNLYSPRMAHLALFSCYVYSRAKWVTVQSTRQAGRTDRKSDPLDTAAAFISEHFQEPLAIEAIAAEAGISKPHLFELFRHRFGESPMQRIIRLRLEHARHLVVNTHLAVKEIAFRSGFRNIVHFGRTFRRHVGASPTQLRKANGGPH